MPRKHVRKFFLTNGDGRKLEGKSSKKRLTMVDPIAGMENASLVNTVLGKKQLPQISTNSNRKLISFGRTVSRSMKNDTMSSSLSLKKVMHERKHSESGLATAMMNNKPDNARSAWSNGDQRCRPIVHEAHELYVPRTRPLSWQ